MVLSLCLQLVMRHGYIAKGICIPLAEWLPHMTSNPGIWRSKPTQVVCALPHKEMHFYIGQHFIGCLCLLPYDSSLSVDLTLMRMCWSKRYSGSEMMGVSLKKKKREL